MVLKADIQKKVYVGILLNLWNGDYLTKARKGFLSECGSRIFFKQMVRDGYITERKDKTNKKYAVFTDKGKKYLKELCPFWNEKNDIKSDEKNDRKSDKMDIFKEEKFDLLKGGIY